MKLAAAAYVLGAALGTLGGAHLALSGLLAGAAIFAACAYIGTACEMPHVCRRVHESAPNVVAFRAPAKRASKGGAA